MTITAAHERVQDQAWFRRTLGQYPTGVCVITALNAGGEPEGMVVGSFTSVSLEPALVAFLPSATSATWARIRPAGSFCVNILAADQEHLCRVFASKSGNKFAGVSWRQGTTGAPILENSVAWIECHLDVVHEAGDHHIVVGRVADLDVERPRLPLLFFQGGYGSFSPRSSAVRDSRFGSQLQLIDRARPLMEQLADETGAQVAAAYCDGNELTVLARAGVTNTAFPPIIGQHLGIAAPLGIWWMAYADQPSVDAWLEGIDSQPARAAYQEAMASVRELGYCLGLASVHDQVGRVLDSRTQPGTAAPGRPETWVADPLSYAPSRLTEGSTAADHPEIVSLWAPAFSAPGEVSLGMMLTGFPPDGVPLRNYAERLLKLASDISDLTPH